MKLIYVSSGRTLSIRFLDWKNLLTIRMSLFNLGTTKNSKTDCNHLSTNRVYREQFHVVGNSLIQSYNVCWRSGEPLPSLLVNNGVFKDFFYTHSWYCHLLPVTLCEPRAEIHDCNTHTCSTSRFDLMYLSDVTNVTLSSLEAHCDLWYWAAAGKMNLTTTTTQ